MVLLEGCSKCVREFLVCHKEGMLLAFRYANCYTEYRIVLNIGRKESPSKC